MKYVDQDGKAIDAFWDAANVGYDFGSFSKNTFESAYNSAGMLWNSYVTGDYNKAAEYANNYDRQVSEAKDAAIDFGLDAGAAAIPFVPAGIRKVDKGADVVNGIRSGVQGQMKNMFSRGSQAISSNRIYEKTGVKIHKYAQRRMVQRNISEDAVINTIRNGERFNYHHNGLDKIGYYDSKTGTFVGSIGNSSTTIVNNVTSKYIQNLKSPKPPL